MPRPRLLLNENQLAAYADAGSLRRAAKTLGVSRWTVGARLRERGDPIRSRENAQDAVRFFDQIEEEKQAASRCAWPRCSVLRAHGFGLCEKHLAGIPETASACVWCARNSFGRGLCNFHEKKMKGLL